MGNNKTNEVLNAKVLMESVRKLSEQHGWATSLENRLIYLAAEWHELKEEVKKWEGHRYRTDREPVLFEVFDVLWNLFDLADMLEFEPKVPDRCKYFGNEVVGMMCREADAAVGRVFFCASKVVGKEMTAQRRADMVIAVQDAIRAVVEVAGLPNADINEAFARKIELLGARNKQ